MGLSQPPEFRSFAGLLEVRAGGDGRTVTGLIAPFYAPTPIGGRYTEMFEPGSFRLNRVPLHAGHPRDDRDMPVSPPGTVWEGRAGVHGEWHLSRTTAADDLLALLGDDPPAITGLSVGFMPDEDEDRWSMDGRVVTRRGADLLHVAAVPKAAYAGARVTSVRAEPPGRGGGRPGRRRPGQTMTWLAALEYAEHRAASPAGPEQMSESEAELEAELAAEREFIARRKALTRKLLGLTRPYR